MADKLELRVIFSAVDKFLRPVKAITQGASEASKALKANNDRLKDLNRTLGQIDSFKKVQADAAITANVFAANRRKIDELAAAIDRVGVPTKAMSKEMDRLTRESDRLKQKHQSLVSTEQTLFEKLKAGGIDTSRLTDETRRLSSAAAEATNASRRLSAALEVENQKARQLHIARAQLNKTKELAGKVAIGGAAVAAGGAAVGLPAAQAAKEYASFEMAMLGVARQMDGARDANGRYTASYYQMADAIKAMSERLPMTANDLAKIVEGGARMGIQGRENLLTYAELTAVMSTAFDLPVEQVGEDIGKISQLYKVPIKDIRALGDTINWLDDNALSKGGDIIDVMKRIAGTADMAKMSFRDAAALGSTFLSLGANPEVAASASNAMIRELAIANMQSKRFKEGLAMLRLDGGAVQAGMSKDATGTIIKVLEAIKALPEKQQLEAATRLFGKEFGDDAAKLASNMDEYRRQLKLVNDERARGSMQREGDARNQTLDARLTMAKNAATNLASALGEHLKPALVETAEKTVATLQAVREWAKENPGLAGGIMTVAKWLAVALTVIGGVMVAAGGLLVPLAMLKFSLTTLGLTGFSAMALLGRGFNIIMAGIGLVGRALMLNPIGLAVTGIATAAFLIYRYWEPIKAFFGGLWGDIKAAFDGGLDGVLRLIASWSPIGAMQRAMASTLDYLGTLLPARFVEFGGHLMDGLAEGIRRGIQAAKDAIGSAGQAVVDFFKDKLGIHSPSRVFEDLGLFTMQGLERGLSGGEDGPLGAMASMARKLAGIGAGVAIGGSAMAGVPLDPRPPLAPAAALMGAMAPMQVNINIYGAPGQDVAEIRRQVELALAAAEAKRAAQYRSRLRDTE